MKSHGRVVREWTLRKRALAVHTFCIFFFGGLFVCSFEPSGYPWSIPFGLIGGAACVATGFYAWHTPARILAIDDGSLQLFNFWSRPIGGFYSGSDTFRVVAELRGEAWALEIREGKRSVVVNLDDLRGPQGLRFMDASRNGMDAKAILFGAEIPESSTPNPQPS